MKATLVFHNDDPLLANIEKENGLCEIDLDFDLAKVLLVGDVIRYRIKNDLGLDQEIFLLVDNRNFDLVEGVLILDCDLLCDDENMGGVSNLGFGQSLN